MNQTPAAQEDNAQPRFSLQVSGLCGYWLDAEATIPSWLHSLKLYKHFSNMSPQNKNCHNMVSE